MASVIMEPSSSGSIVYFGQAVARLCQSHSWKVKPYTNKLTAAFTV